VDRGKRGQGVGGSAGPGGRGSVEGSVGGSMGGEGDEGRSSASRHAASRWQQNSGVAGGGGGGGGGKGSRRPSAVYNESVGVGGDDGFMSARRSESGESEVGPRVTT